MQIKVALSYSQLLPLMLFLIATSKIVSNETVPDDHSPLIITEKIYSNIFIRKREEHKTLVNHIYSTEDYSKRYDLLKIAYREILKVIKDNGAILRENQLIAGSEFPKKKELAETLANFLENTCLFGELILHLPDISYRVLKGVDKWRVLTIEALVYVRSFVNIMDQKSLELLALLEQEIDENKRSQNYVNPYWETMKGSSKQQNKSKKKKTLKKGPQLSDNGKTEL